MYEIYPIEKVEGIEEIDTASTITEEQSGTSDTSTSVDSITHPKETSIGKIQMLKKNVLTEPPTLLLCGLEAVDRLCSEDDLCGNHRCPRRKRMLLARFKLKPFSPRNLDDLAGDHSCLLAREEQNGFGNILGRDKLTHRNER